jgi:hypothetical protein
MLLLRDYRFLGLILLIGACKPPEPSPSQYTNLGTAEAPLLPPPQAWHDPNIVKGSSEWRPFRKPSEGEAKSATSKVPGGATVVSEDKPDGATGTPDAEKEIRNLVADFNTALAEGKLDEATEFLTDAQAQASGDVFAAIHQLVEQLRLLQAATPALTEKIDALVPLLNVNVALTLELQTIRLVDAKTATATLAGGAEAHFVIGEEDLWYIESPVLAVLEKERPRIQKVAKEIEETLSKGTPDEAAVTALGTALDDLRTALSASSKTPGESG